MDGPFQQVRLAARGARRFRSLHPWVFRDDVADAGGASHGDTVCVLDATGRVLGHAAYSDRSKIALRRLAVGPEPPTGATWRERCGRAAAWRRDLAAGSGACRLVFGESDGLPGFIADRYAGHLVVQCLTAWAARHCERLLDALSESLSIESVLARNDPAVRDKEGLPREVRQLRGTTPAEIEFVEAGLRQPVDPWGGQKTGAFLDQSENRIAAARWAAGRVLDAFTYQGGFALVAAARGAEVVAVDSSAEALGRARLAVERNGLGGRVELVEANVFDELRRRDRAGERFDSVLLDPPAFAKSRRDVDAARRAYKEVNLRAMRLLRPGGMLITSSCSYNLGEEALVEILEAAARDVGRTAWIVERRGQSRDHPVELGFPESRYLKCLVLRIA